MRRRQQFISGQLGWMLGAIVLLAVLGSLTLELFFVVSLIGFFVLLELTAPLAVTPRWRSRLTLIAVFGLLVFGLLVVRRVLEILSSGVG